MGFGTFAGAILGSSLISGLIGDRAANRAADAQIQTSESGIHEIRRQFDAIQNLLRPYIESGVSSLDAQRAIAGLEGPEAEKEAVRAISASPLYQEMVAQGEQGILQNAAATGGLRSGNTQTALASYRPQVLNQLLNERYNRLAGITNLGQASATGQASAGQQTGSQIAGLFGQQGAARAGAHLARGRYLGNFTDTLGSLGALHELKVF